MSDDLDFPKANHALRVLRQARLSRNETATTMVGDLVYGKHRLADPRNRRSP
jgi:hypothetical protein